LLYLVGGAVRDKLLGKKTLDTDLACCGDVKRFGERLALKLASEFLYYPQFKTGTIEGPGGQRIDLAMTRKEQYPAQGVLPKVQKAGIEEDLYRRDFTVNAIAQSLNPKDYGEIIDPLGARGDLEKGLIRVIHDGSFADDPTRIFRAVRYAERLGFRIESWTLKLLKEAVPSIKKLSGERLLYELRCIMHEGKEARLRIIKRSSKLGALDFLGSPVTPLSPARLSRIVTEESCEFLCLLFSHFEETRVTRLPLSKPCLATVATLRERKKLFSKLAGLNTPSRITFFLRTYDERGLRILSEVQKGSAAEKLATYLDDYRNITIRTTGDDLVKLGVRPGPSYKELLDAALAARMDGKVKSKREELALIKKLIRR
jgi:tRNA nucleotidyltransferase (CCA-adding enzyme)